MFGRGNAFRCQPNASSTRPAGFVVKTAPSTESRPSHAVSGSPTGSRPPGPQPGHIRQPQPACRLGHSLPSPTGRSASCTRIRRAPCPPRPVTGCRPSASCRARHVALRVSPLAHRPPDQRDVPPLHRRLGGAHRTVEARLGCHVPVVDADEPPVCRVTPADPPLVHQRRKPAPYGSVVGIGDDRCLPAHFPQVTRRRWPTGIGHATKRSRFRAAQRTSRRRDRSPPR